MHVQNTVVRFMLAIMWVLCKGIWKRQLRAWCAYQKNCVSAILDHNCKHHVHEEHGYRKMYAHCVPNVWQKSIKIRFWSFFFTSSVVDRGMWVFGVCINSQWNLHTPFHSIEHKRSWNAVETLSVCKSKSIQCVSVSWKSYSVHILGYRPSHPCWINAISHCRCLLQLPLTAAWDYWQEDLWTSVVSCEVQDSASPQSAYLEIRVVSLGICGSFSL